MGGKKGSLRYSGDKVLKGRSYPVADFLSHALHVQSPGGGGESEFPLSVK